MPPLTIVPGDPYPEDSGVAWGEIPGVLSDQADLQAALNDKEPANANIQAHINTPHAPSNAQKNSDITKAEIEAKLTGEISSHTHAGGSQAFPIGAVFIAVVSTDPSTLLGYGTWSAFGAGKVLVGLDSADTDFDTAEETGGAKTQTPSAHAGTAVADHAAGVTGANSGNAVKIGTGASNASPNAHTHATPALVHQVTQPSNHSAMSIVQPYVVVYIWKRVS